MSDTKDYTIITCPPSITIAVCNACSALVWDENKHDHYCPARTQKPIGDVSPGAFIESIEMEQSK